MARSSTSGPVQRTKGSPDFCRISRQATKGAIRTAFSRALSRELGGQQDLRQHALAPGFTISDSVLENIAHHEKWRAPIVAGRAMKREMLPEDLRGAIVFLSSPESDFVTGQTISVCGGSINT